MEKKNKTEIDNIERKEGKIVERYQPHLLTFREDSSSTPLRLVTTSNRKETTNLSGQPQLADIENFPSSLSYNDLIRTYKYSMSLSPISNAVQQNIAPAILTSDISRAFLTLKKGPIVALSELEFYYVKQDKSPTFNQSQARQLDPEVFVRHFCSYGSSDLPVAFAHIIQHSVKVYREHYLGNGIENIHIIPLPEYNPNLDYNDPIVREALEKTVIIGTTQVFEKISDNCLDFLDILLKTNLYCDDILLKQSPVQCLNTY